MVGFPKFDAIGIGVRGRTRTGTVICQYTRDAAEIYEGSSAARGDDTIPAGDYIRAMRMIQDAAGSVLTEHDPGASVGDAQPYGEHRS